MSNCTAFFTGQISYWCLWLSLKFPCAIVKLNHIAMVGSQYSYTSVWYKMSFNLSKEFAIAAPVRYIDSKPFVTNKQSRETGSFVRHGIPTFLESMEKEVSFFMHILSPLPTEMNSHHSTWLTIAQYTFGMHTSEDNFVLITPTTSVARSRNERRVTNWKTIT